MKRSRSGEQISLSVPKAPISQSQAPVCNPRALLEDGGGMVGQEYRVSPPSFNIMTPSKQSSKFRLESALPSPLRHDPISQQGCFSWITYLLYAALIFYQPPPPHLYFPLSAGIRHPLSMTVFLSKLQQPVRAFA